MTHVRAALFALIAAPLLTGCPSRLPGPSECQEMAARLVSGGRSENEKPPTSQERRFFQIVTHGCLTTPFDFETVHCVEDTRSLAPCASQLGRRFPERKPALKDFLKRARRYQPLNP